MENNHIVYAITNPTTNKVVYVGRTKDLFKRKRTHRYNKGTDIYKFLMSLKARGINAEYSILCVCSDSDVLTKEREFIRHFSTIGELINTHKHKPSKYYTPKDKLNPNQNIGMPIH